MAKAPVKLHELLAVHSNHETQVEKTSGELRDTFTKKEQRFRETLVVIQWNEQGKPDTKEEQSALQSTVADELNWISGFFANAVDVEHQIDKANQIAVADVILDDEGETVILRNMPATTLLSLEKRLNKFQELCATIPTLDPTKAFEIDTTFRKPGVYKSREVVAPKTAKFERPLVLAEATKEHPAQVQLRSYDEVVGHRHSVEWSGMITPAAKADIHARVDQLIRAVKKARARANAVEIDTSAKIGKVLFDFIIGPGVRATAK